MAGRKEATKAQPQPPAVEAELEAAPPASDRAKLTDKQLAKAVLAKELRPRVGEVRRLAEAVLKKAAPKSAKKGKKAKSGKLAKIPQKKK